MSTSVSGLSPQHRVLARRRTVAAATLGLNHKAALHYTQDSRRWEGIGSKLIAAHGHFPDHADCSAFATWCLWNGLHVPFNIRDVVNGLHWRAGFTGTMVNHGKQVHSPAHWLPGDLALYGDPNGSTGHVAVYVGHGYVISFGSEAGPFLLPVHYRPDFRQMRRYI